MEWQTALRDPEIAKELSEGEERYTHHRAEIPGMGTILMGEGTERSSATVNHAQGGRGKAGIGSRRAISRDTSDKAAWRAAGV